MMMSLIESHLSLSFGFKRWIKNPLQTHEYKWIDKVKMNTALDKSKTEKETDIQDEWVFRKPQLSDGDKVHALIQACPPLDTNSAYCNFYKFHTLAIPA